MCNLHWKRVSKNFNPLPPHGGRHNQNAYHVGDHVFQSTPSAWRETQSLHRRKNSHCISIHSLRMEGDLMRKLRELFSANFNPLPPHGGRRDRVQVVCLCNVFQSTPSAWRETRPPSRSIFSDPVFQSTPSAWRETDYQRSFPNQRQISIHSLRMEGDHISERVNCQISHFNPLPPHGGRRINRYSTIF